MDSGASICGKQPLEQRSNGDVGQARDVMVNADEVLLRNCVRYQFFDGCGECHEHAMVVSVHCKHIIDDPSVVLVGTGWVLYVWSRVCRVSPWDSRVGGIHCV